MKTLQVALLSFAALCQVVHPAPKLSVKKEGDRRMRIQAKHGGTNSALFTPTATIVVSLVILVVFHLVYSMIESYRTDFEGGRTLWGIRSGLKEGGISVLNQNSVEEILWMDEGRRKDILKNIFLLVSSILYIIKDNEEMSDLNVQIIKDICSVYHKPQGRPEMFKTSLESFVSIADET